MEFQKVENGGKVTWKEVVGPDWLKPADEGVVTGRIMAWHPDNGKGPAISMLVDGTVVKVGLTTVLAQKITQDMVGETVRITFLGQVKPKSGGRAFQDFKVEVAESGSKPKQPSQDPF